MSPLPNVSLPAITLTSGHHPSKEVPSIINRLQIKGTVLIGFPISNVKFKARSTTETTQFNNHLFLLDLLCFSVLPRIQIGVAFVVYLVSMWCGVHLFCLVSGLRARHIDSKDSKCTSQTHWPCSGSLLRVSGWSQLPSPRAHFRPQREDKARCCYCRFQKGKLAFSNAVYHCASIY